MQRSSNVYSLPSSARPSERTPASKTSPLVKVGAFHDAWLGTIATLEIRKDLVRVVAIAPEYANGLHFDTEY